MQAVQKLSTCNNFNTVQTDAETGYIQFFDLSLLILTNILIFFSALWPDILFG